MLSSDDKLYLEKKRPQPKGINITLVSDKISEICEFLMQNLAKCGDKYCPTKIYE